MDNAFGSSGRHLSVTIAKSFVALQVQDRDVSLRFQDMWRPRMARLDSACYDNGNELRTNN